MMIWIGRSLLFNLLKGLIRLQFPSVRCMTTVELGHWLADSAQPNPLILDARTEAEYAVSHLQAARRIDPTTAAWITLKPFSTIAKDTPIVVYCSVGYRSAKVVQQLQQAGFSCVFNLEGSLFQWANEERSLFQNGQLTQGVHPYSPAWGRLLKVPDRRQ